MGNKKERNNVCREFLLYCLCSYWTNMIDLMKNEWPIHNCETCQGVAVSIIISNLKELKNITVSASGLEVWVLDIGLQFPYRDCGGKISRNLAAFPVKLKFEPVCQLLESHCKYMAEKSSIWLKNQIKSIKSNILEKLLLWELYQLTSNVFI